VSARGPRGWREAVESGGVPAIHFQTSVGQPCATRALREFAESMRMNLRAQDHRYGSALLHPRPRGTKGRGHEDEPLPQGAEVS
jgi:hypothetical protein